MCPTCAAPAVVSDDEFRGGAQLAPYVPILPSRASKHKFALRTEDLVDWEQLKEVDQHTGARTWTMPGDGADA